MVTIDLAAQVVTAPDGAPHRFEIDPFRKQALLEGLDDIGLTLRHEAAIAAFEARHAVESSLGGAGPARCQRDRVADESGEPAAGRERLEAARRGRPFGPSGRGRPVKPDRVGRWQPVQSEWAFRSGFVSLRRDRCRLPDGRLSPDMYFMELRDFAMTVAVTPGGEVLLSREYKHGAGDVALHAAGRLRRAGRGAGGGRAPGAPRGDRLRR